MNMLGVRQIMLKMIVLRSVRVALNRNGNPRREISEMGDSQSVKTRYSKNDFINMLKERLKEKDQHLKDKDQHLKDKDQHVKEFRRSDHQYKELVAQLLDSLKGRDELLVAKTGLEVQATALERASLEAKGSMTLRGVFERWLQRIAAESTVRFNATQTLEQLIRSSPG
jgi:hypothetical protein